jgi:hypothetical protein
MARVRSLWPAAGSLVVILVGAFRPWAKRSGLTVDGTDDEVVLVAALAAGVALIVFALTANRRLAAVPLLVGLVSVLLTGRDVSDPAGPFGGPGPNIHLEWGIWVALAGSVGLTLASLALLVETAGVGGRWRHSASRRPQGKHGQAERQARVRRAELVPQLRSYNSIDRVFWPILTATARPNFVSPVVSTDSRGHRITRVEGKEARSDPPPDGAAFLMGGSYAFGVGASDDSGTLAAALWRRTGVPFVNLGIRAANSAQELVSVLPFAERETMFVVCSGLNNLATARGAAGIDPFFGPMHHEAQLRVLADVSIAKLSRLPKRPLTLFEDEELVDELGRRQRARLRKASSKTRSMSGTANPPRTRLLGENRDPVEIMHDAAARQLRDLRLLRNLVPNEAGVVFALQPFAWYTGKQLSEEEEELFALLDLIQPNNWSELKVLLETQWDAYAALLERGCEEAQVSFIDLGRGDYVGWCFIDRVHGTDHGYETAAELLLKVLPR